MEGESQAEASEDARKRASSMKVKTGEIWKSTDESNCRSAAFRCYIAASLVAEDMWVFTIFGRVRSTEATHAPKKERK